MFEDVFSSYHTTPGGGKRATLYHDKTTRPGTCARCGEETAARVRFWQTAAMAGVSVYWYCRRCDGANLPANPDTALRMPSCRVCGRRALVEPVWDHRGRKRRLALRARCAEGCEIPTPHSDKVSGHE